MLCFTASNLAFSSVICTVFFSISILFSFPVSEMRFNSFCLSELKFLVSRLILFSFCDSGSNCLQVGHSNAWSSMSSCLAFIKVHSSRNWSLASLSCCDCLFSVFILVNIEASKIFPSSNSDSNTLILFSSFKIFILDSFKILASSLFKSI